MRRLALILILLAPLAGGQIARAASPPPLPDGPNGPVQVTVRWVAYIDHTLPNIPGKAWLCIRNGDFCFTFGFR